MTNPNLPLGEGAAAAAEEGRDPKRSGQSPMNAPPPEVAFPHGEGGRALGPDG